MMHDAVNFIQQVIRRCDDLKSLVDGKSMADRLLLHLTAIRGMKKAEEEDVFREIAQANVYLCIADLAKHNADVVFTGNFSLIGEC